MNDDDAAGDGQAGRHPFFDPLADAPEPAADGARSNWTWLLRGIVMLLSVAVAVSMVVLWPHRDGAAVGPKSQLPKTELAKVTKLELADCQVPDADKCLEVTAKLLSGPDRGDHTTFLMGEAASDGAPGMGDRIRVVKSQVPAGTEMGDIKVPPYMFNDFERRAPTLWLVAIFVGIVLLAGRFHGLRALVGLALSLGVVVWFIIPALVQGDQAVVVAIVGALAVMLLTIPLSHGFGSTTLAATLGTSVSLLVTLALALTFAHLSHLTGYSGGDEVAYLAVYLKDLSVQGLLLAGIVISALGVLDDVTVSQASTVMALRRANPLLGFGALYREALVVGRDHIAATVNTLVLAYVGASLPVLLIFSVGNVSLADAFNGESVAAQVVSTLVGSIGLITAVPVTTALAALLATRMTPAEVVEAAAHGHTH